MLNCTKAAALHLVSRMPDSVERDAALKKVEAATSFATLDYDGPPDDPDSDYIGVFVDGEEIAVVWN